MMKRNGSPSRDVKKGRFTKEQERAAQFLEKVLNRIETLRSKDQSGYACRLIERVMNQFPFSADLYYALGCCQFDLGDIRLALRSFSTAYFFDPTSPDFMLGLADSLFILGWPNRGLKLIKKILNKDPGHFIARLMYGRCLEGQEKWDKALEQYGLIQDQHDHQSYPVLLGRFGSCMMNTNRLDKAIDFFDEALRLLPTDPESLFNRGLCYGTQGQYSKALGDFEELLKINPDDPETLAYAALYLFYQGNKLLATARIEKAVEMDPENRLIADVRDEIFSNDPPEQEEENEDDEEE